jgi:hypothetical protein
MESTSRPDRIQISRSTADHLIAFGKEHWIKPREDIVHAKGLGALRTFWLQIGMKELLSTSSSHEEISTTNETHSTERKEANSSKHQKNVDWIVDLLLSHIRPMVCNLFNYTFPTS